MSYNVEDRTRRFIMYKFGEKHPFILEIILTLLAFGLAIASYYVGQYLGYPPVFTFLLGMIAIGLLLMLLFIRAFIGEKPKRSFLVALPSLLFIVWNIYYNLDSGNKIGDTDWLIRAAITAIAVAVFEEVLYRGIFIYNLERNDFNAFGCLVFSSLFYVLTQILSFLGKDLLSTGLAVAYALVLGLALSAAYQRNHRILQIVLIRFLIEFSSEIFAEKPSGYTQLQLIIFVSLLVVELLYANIIALVGRKKEIIS